MNFAQIHMKNERQTIAKKMILFIVMFLFIDTNAYYPQANHYKDKSAINLNSSNHKHHITLHHLLAHPASGFPPAPRRMIASGFNSSPFPKISLISNKCAQP